MIHLKENEVNNLLGLLDDIVSWRTGWSKPIENSENKILKKLDGYVVKCETDGDHKNDGQMVEYTFTLKSPKGEISKIETDMCLAVGWNYYNDLTIK